MTHLILMFKGQEDLERVKLVDSYAEAVDYINWCISKPVYDTNNHSLSPLHSHYRIDRIDGFGRYEQGKTYIFKEN